MDSLESVNLLLEERRNLYGKLLQCSREQLSLLDRLNGAEEFPAEFVGLQDQWEKTASRVDIIQKKLEEKAQGQDFQDTELVEMMQECISNASLLQHSLLSYKESLSSDFQNVRDQRAIMNAYYGMNRRAPMSVYFDEKN